jgi:hypothetical protein
MAPPGADPDEVVSVVAEAFASGRVTATPLADGSGVFLNVGTLEVAQVDPTGMWIVEALASGTNDIRSLAAGLCDRYDVDSRRAKEDLTGFLLEIARLAGHGSP